MASIRERNGKFNVIYSYTNEKGERKQKWEIYETKVEAKRRKKKTGRFLRMKEMSLLSITMNWAYGHAPHTGDTFAFVGF